VPLGRAHCDQYVLNPVIVWVALRWASLVGRLLGEAGCRAMTKVLSLVLAAIAVTFIRRGGMSALTR
jgi:small neutral amino acid transporter SnatA (MarC family)